MYALMQPEQTFYDFKQNNEYRESRMICRIVPQYSQVIIIIECNVGSNIGMC